MASLAELLQPQRHTVGGGRADPRARTAQLQDILAAMANPDFEGFRGELTAFAESIAGDIFGEGGAVEQGYRGVLGDAVGSGFGPSSGSVDRGIMDLISQGRDVVGQGITQGAMQILPLALERDSNVLSGAFGIEALRNAWEQLRQNQSIIDASLQQEGCGLGDRIGGAAGGALAGFGKGGFNPWMAGLGGLAGLFGSC